MLDVRNSNQNAVDVGAIVVSGQQRRTVVRMHDRDDVRLVDLATRINARYDVRTVTLSELKRRLRTCDRLEPPPPSLLPEVTVDNEVSARVRQLLIEAAVQAIGTAFFVNGCLACEVLDVCRHWGTQGAELRVVVACQQLDVGVNAATFLNSGGEAVGGDQIESIDVEHWVQLMVATDWTTLPMPPACGELLSEAETQRYLRELIGEEFADGEIEP